MAKEMVKVRTSGQTVTSMKVNGKITKETAEGSPSGQTVTSMKVNGKIANITAKKDQKVFKR